MKTANVKQMLKVSSDPGKLEWTAAAALPNTRRDRALSKKEMQPAHSRYSKLL